ncbi:response regulator [Desulforegula conservatrix]|uniref:response regulator n=1 Tax=Desulforegula conservatrix TaxID=153026 RepID=UPI00040506D7|nr:response regulator [Desulforegula conservatrix]
MSSKHILIVDDEEKIASLVSDYLKNDGYETFILHRGDLVIPSIRKTPPDLIVLDIMMPGMDGISVCREIRKFSEIPIIMLTAKTDEIDRLIGLEIGADDYVCKPFSPRELVARIKAVLRRTERKTEEKIITEGNIRLETETRRVLVNGSEIKLTPSEFGLLASMMSQPDRVFSRNDLLRQVQGYEYEGYDRTIDTHIKNLRKKIGEKIEGENPISGVYGVGYRFSIASK